MDRATALAASRSSTWQHRADAAEVLATMGDAEADAAVIRLLNDDDLAVVRRAAACLLALPTATALACFTSVYAVADDQAGDSMNDELRVAVAMDQRVRPALGLLADAGDSGARSALAWLG